MNISPVTTGNAASGATTKPMKTPRRRTGASSPKARRSVHPCRAGQSDVAKAWPTASTKTITGSTTNILAITLVAT